MEKTFELTADSKQITSFRSTLRELLGQGHWGEKETNDVLLAVQEVLTNILRHAYDGKTGPIKIDFSDAAERVKVSIQDWGVKFDITKVPDPDLPRHQPGGLGIFLVKKLMDRVEYDAECHEGNLIHLTKFRKAPSS